MAVEGRNERTNNQELLPGSELSRENIEQYVAGCEEIAVRLDSTIEKIIAKDKRPVILIPSRGAVPIFLMARKILNSLDPENSYLADKNANYYPAGIFDYLEGNDPQDHSPNAKVDIILYPFTADVSSEEKEEWLARRLRESCARAVLELHGIDLKSHDFT